jgi:hypothetical protein
MKGKVFSKIVKPLQKRKPNMSGLGHLNSSFGQSQWQCLNDGRHTTNYPPSGMKCPECGGLMRKVDGPEQIKEIYPGMNL